MFPLHPGLIQASLPQANRLKHRLPKSKIGCFVSLRIMTAEFSVTF
jgi:hypothetical protein